MTETRTRRVASFANACRWVATRTDVEGLTVANAAEYPFAVFVSEVFLRDMTETVNTINSALPTAVATTKALEDITDSSDGLVEASA